LLIVFLFPVAIYLAILAGINRRSQPLLVPGSWDFAGLLFASSGFILVVGPAIVTIFLLRGTPHYLIQGGGRDFPQWMAAVLGSSIFWWGIYYFAIFAGSSWLLWQRRQHTVIYNVQPEAFENTLVAVLDQQQVSWQRQGKRYFLTASTPAAVAEDVAKEAIQEKHHLDLHGRPEGHSRTTGLFGEEPRDSAASVAVDPFPLFCNVVLHWNGPAAWKWKERVEPELERALTSIYTEENPVSGWLLSISALLFLIMIFSTGMVILFEILFRGR
jgi:hypothetical protein